MKSIPCAAGGLEGCQRASGGEETTATTGAVVVPVVQH